MHVEIAAADVDRAQAVLERRVRLGVRRLRCRRRMDYRMAQHRRGPGAAHHASDEVGHSELLLRHRRHRGVDREGARARRRGRRQDAGAERTAGSPACTRHRGQRLHPLAGRRSAPPRARAAVEHAQRLPLAARDRCRGATTSTRALSPSARSSRSRRTARASRRLPLDLHRQLVEMARRARRRAGSAARAPSKPSSTRSISLGKTLTPRMIEHVVGAPEDARHARERPAADARLARDRREVAGAVAQQRERLLRQRREHELADLAVGNGCAGLGIDRPRRGSGPR